MPSMAQAEPLGLAAMSREGLPWASTYWVAIWPFFANCSSTLRGATKRPSPWEMGTLYTSPTLDLSIQGLCTEATRTSQ